MIHPSPRAVQPTGPCTAAASSPQPVTHPAAAPDPEPGAGSRSRRSLPPGAFHGPGRDHLQKFKAPGSFLDPGGEISSRPKIQQRGVRNRPRTQTLQQLNAPGQITGTTAVGR